MLVGRLSCLGSMRGFEECVVGGVLEGDELVVAWGGTNRFNRM